MHIEILSSFLDAYDQLAAQEKERVQRAVERLGEDWHHPSLRVKRLRGKEGIWEAPASPSIRITFEMEGDKIILRNVGAHDKTIKDA